MKKFTKLLGIVLIMALVMSMGITAAFAAGETPSITIKPNNDTDVTTSTTIKYTYYKILSADIDTDPVVNQATGEATTNGKVAYYVTDSAQATALSGTGVFTVTRVGETNKWYVELVEGKTVDDIIKAFNNDTFLSNFTKQEYTSEGGDAVLPDVSAGYYFIKSSLGSKIAVQTLSPVTINEKNEYVTDDKTIPEADKNSQIGQEITYTLTVNVPATATEQIVLTDTMSKGLTFKEVKSQKIGTSDAAAAAAADALKGAISEVTATDNDATKFTITWTADQVKAIVGTPAAAKVITVEVVVTVNKDAEIDTAIPNTLDLKYGNNYDAVPHTVNTVTTSFTFDKVDGSNSGTKLTGAEFNLKIKGGAVLDLIEVTEGVEYRIATAAEIADTSVTTTQTIKTNGNTVTVKGVDEDVTYQLVETKAPTGYNKLNEPQDVKPETNSALHVDVENNKGTQLPSTGGIGTTIFYVVGSILVVAAGVLLITKKRMSREG